MSDSYNTKTLLRPQTLWRMSKLERGFPLAVVPERVGNMASPDVHVRICEQEILKYDLEIKALIQVRVLHW